MAVTRVKTAINSLTTNTANTATFASSAVATTGNRLVSIFATNASPGTITPPSGWSLIASVTTTGASFVYIYEKVSNGTETGAAFSWTTSRLSDVYVWELTPCVLQTSSFQSNTSSAATSLSTGSGVTNEVIGSMALGGLSTVNSTGATSVNNSFTIESNFSARLKPMFKELSSVASNTATFTWSTERGATAYLLIYREPPVGNTGNMFQMFM